MDIASVCDDFPLNGAVTIPLVSRMTRFPSASMAFNTLIIASSDVSLRIFAHCS